MPNTPEVVAERSVWIKLQLRAYQLPALLKGIGWPSHFEIVHIHAQNQAEAPVSEH
jgi:hypothetical protein